MKIISHWQSSDINLHLVVSSFDAAGQYIESVYSNNLQSEDESVRHSAHSAEGYEEIEIDFKKLSSKVIYIIGSLYINGGDKFSALSSCCLTICDSKESTDVKFTDFHEKHNSATFVTARRINGKWEVQKKLETYLCSSHAALFVRAQSMLSPFVSGLQMDTVTKKVLKGESCLLDENIECITLGLGWDGGIDLDLDASCVMFARNGKKVDHVFFTRLKNDSETVCHSGDSLEGEYEGDDEKIWVNLDKLPRTVHSLLFCITSYNGHTFKDTKNCYVRMLQPPQANIFGEGAEVFRFELNGDQNPDSSMIMCKLYRSEHSPTRWKIQFLGVGGTGRTFEDLLPTMEQLLTGRFCEHSSRRSFRSFHKKRCLSIIPAIREESPALTSQQKTGMGNLVVVGLLVMALVCILFITLK